MIKYIPSEKDIKVNKIMERHLSKKFPEHYGITSKYVK